MITNLTLEGRMNRCRQLHTEARHVIIIIIIINHNYSEEHNYIGSGTVNDEDFHATRLKQRTLFMGPRDIWMDLGLFKA